MGINDWTTTNMVLDEVSDERHRQDDKWGEQNHPSLDQGLLNRSGGVTAKRMAEEYEIPTASRARWMCQEHARRGDVTWAHILMEEVAEAIEAGVESTEKLRAELVQVAAVTVSWIESIDRNGR